MPVDLPGVEDMMLPVLRSMEGGMAPTTRWAAERYANSPERS